MRHKHHRIQLRTACSAMAHSSPADAVPLHNRFPKPAAPVVTKTHTKVERPLMHQTLALWADRKVDGPRRTSPLIQPSLHPHKHTASSITWFLQKELYFPESKSSMVYWFLTLCMKLAFFCATRLARCSRDSFLRPNLNMEKE